PAARASDRHEQARVRPPGPDISLDRVERLLHVHIALAGALPWLDYGGEARPKDVGRECQTPLVRGRRQRQRQRAGRDDGDESGSRAPPTHRRLPPPTQGRTGSTPARLREPRPSPEISIATSSSPQPPPPGRRSAAAPGGSGPR